mgnify:FL=1
MVKNDLLKRRKKKRKRKNIKGKDKMTKDIKVEDKIITIDNKEYKESELSPTVKNNLAILGDCNNKKILASLDVAKNDILIAEYSKRINDELDKLKDKK